MRWLLQILIKHASPGRSGCEKDTYTWSGGGHMPLHAGDFARWRRVGTLPIRRVSFLKVTSCQNNRQPLSLSSDGLENLNYRSKSPQIPVPEVRAPKEGVTCKINRLTHITDKISV